MATSIIKRNVGILININRPKILRWLVIFSSSILVIGLILFAVSFKTFGKKIVMNTVASASAGALDSSSTNKNFAIGLNIANNGLVFIRNAEVVSVTDDKKIHITLDFSGLHLAWAVKVGNLTKILNAKGQEQNLDNINSGDIVTVTGQLVDGGSQTEPLVNAEFVRTL